MTKTSFRKIAIAAAFMFVVSMAGLTVPTESSPAYASAVSALTVGVHVSGAAGIGS